MSLSKRDMSRSAPTLVIVLMISVVCSQGSGLSRGGALKSFQGSFSIVLVGAPIITVVTILKNGLKAHGLRLFSRAAFVPRVWWTGLKSLSPKRLWDLKWAILSLAGTSYLINMGGVVAVRELGSGQAAAITTVFSLLVGACTLRYAPQWLVRLAVVFLVFLAARLSGEGGASTLGYVAAACAGSHMWNLPKRLVRLNPKQDEGLAVANLISAPFVLVSAWGWDSHQGVTWEWGSTEIAGALFPGLLVMVIPVFLQNWAAKLGMVEQDQGAMAAMAAPLHALAGWILSPVTPAITGQAAVLPTLDQGAVFVIVFVVALLAPLMPKVDTSRPKVTDTMRPAAMP